MGYRPPEQTYKLVFADEDMAGFEVRLKSASSEKILELSELKPDLSNTQAIRELYEYFVTRVLSWNLEDDEGNPMPVSASSLYAQEPAWVFRVISAWLKASATSVQKAEARLDLELESTLPVEALV